MYKPLPDSLTIKDSSIQGLGLFAKLDIKSKTNLGLSHIHNKNYKNSYIRTPLGGFFNHNAVNPNCRILESDGFLYLITMNDIKQGEELTAKYTLYDPLTIANSWLCYVSKKI